MPDLVQAGITLLLAALVYRGGYARGRYVHKQLEEPETRNCICTHKVTSHAGRGTGACMTVIDARNSPCACTHYVPRPVDLSA